MSKEKHKMDKGIHAEDNNPMKKTLVVNHHTAAIIVPRSIPGQAGALHRIDIGSLVFPPGSTTRVDAEVWGKVKATNKMVQGYLAANLLSETRNGDTIVSTVSRTSYPVPPEHLKSPDELQSDIATVRLEHANVRQMQI